MDTRLAAAVTNTARGGRVVMLGLLPPGEQPVPTATAIERELELTAEVDGMIAVRGTSGALMHVMSPGRRS